MESLIHNSLSSKSSIAMNQDGHHLDRPHDRHSRADKSVYPLYKSRFTTSNLKNKPRFSRYKSHYLLSLSVSSIELFSFGLALNHWIHCLQVRRVRHERQRDVLFRFTVDPLVVHPKVVFDITRTLQVCKKRKGCEV